jgi:hypothetical protein
MDTIYRGIVNRTSIKPSPTVSWLALTTCFAILLHHHDQQPWLLTNWLLGIDSSTTLPIDHAKHRHGDTSRMTSQC